MKKFVFLITMILIVVTPFAKGRMADIDTTLTQNTENNSNTSYWFWGIGAAILILAVLSFIQKNWKRR